jgi:hypothetical protein
VIGAVLIALASGQAGAALVPAQLPPSPLLRSTPSDPRAHFFPGNATTCAQVGFPGDTQLGAPQANSASDGNVSGVAGPNAGTVQPGVGQEVNITVSNVNIVVHAVVVKGGNGYNVYSDAPVLPPALPPPQHYIAPVNAGGNVPNLSHWFVCYGTTVTPPSNSLTVQKTVIPPVGPLATPLPTAFTVAVDCGNGLTATVNFGSGGGRPPGPTLTNIPSNSVCKVSEQTTPPLPAGTTVSYTPPEANTNGVTVGAGVGIVVTVTNDFSTLKPESGNLELVKVVVPSPAGVALPSSFTVTVVCDDGTTAAVSLPGTGGAGPLVSASVGAQCTLLEDASTFPAGVAVTYSLNGGAASETPPIFMISATDVVTVTITNDASAVAPVTTVPTTAPTVPPTEPPSVAPTNPGTLPPTGAATDLPLLLGFVLVAAGLVAIGYTTRHRAWRDRG